VLRNVIGALFSIWIRLCINLDFVFQDAEFIAAQIIPVIIGIIFYIFLPEKTLANTIAIALFAAVLWFGINMGLALEEFTP